MAKCNKCGMEGLIWRIDQYDKPKLYNPNNELFHACNSSEGDFTNFAAKDYWICSIHLKSLLMLQDSMRCPISECSQSSFIRKSYHDELKHYKKDEKHEESKPLIKKEQDTQEKTQTYSTQIISHSWYELLRARNQNRHEDWERVSFTHDYTKCQELDCCCLSPFDA